MVISLVAILLLIGVYYFIQNRAIDDFELNRKAVISYSKHAKCRMSCRHIDRDEVGEVVKKGKVNLRKSQPKEGTIALEGNTHDDQFVRIIVAKKSENKLHVVTVIDLDTEWPCHCK